MAGLSKGTPTPPPPTTKTTTGIREGPTEIAQSPRDETSFAGPVRKINTVLMTVGSCRTRRKETLPTNLKINLMVMVRPVVSSDNFEGEVLAFFCYMCFL
jgi:hypothetical protein